MAEHHPQGGVAARLHAALAGRYEIERELGRGGMATVYLARDVRHDRRVALKALDPALGVTLSAERFLREIRVTARMAHPHILPLHDSGEADGLLYYVTPFVEGETLRDRLGHGPLTTDFAVRLIRDVASALAWAHRQGVVHRDVKPANILLQDEHAVVADFGIARAVRRALEPDDDGSERAQPTLTNVGASLGTPAYMAPEQIAGDRVDERADLYAWGVVAWEALAGTHPFGARAGLALIAAHLSEKPPSLDTLRPDLPPGLSDVVMRCLEKDPSLRPQSAEEIVAALEVGHPSSASFRTARGWAARRRLTAAAGAMLMLLGVGAAITFMVRSAWRTNALSEVTDAPAAMRSLAVIPFSNIGGIAEDEYFSDGLTDELAHALAGLPGLRLAGRTATFAFKNKAVPAQEIGRTLEVGAIIVGTVRRSGDRLRVTTQLVSTADGKIVLDSIFEGRSGEVFRVQDDFTRAIIAALSPALGGHPATAGSSGTRGTTDTEAYNLYLKGRYYWLERGAENVEESISLFQQAIDRDSTFARAHAGLAMAYDVLGVYVANAIDSTMALSEASARRAMALDSTLADSQIAWTQALMWRLRFDDAIAGYRRALALEPSNQYAHHAFGHTLSITGHTDEAIAELRRATQLDPLAKSAGTSLAVALIAARRFPEAIAESRRVLAIDSTFTLGLHILGLAQVFAEQPDSAVRTLERAARLDPGSPRSSTFLLFAYAAAGRWADADVIRGRLHRTGSDPSSGTEAAFADLVFGDMEPALELLATDAGKRQWLALLVGFGCVPLIDPLWSDPGFRESMRTKGIEPCPLARAWPIPARPSPSVM